VWLREFVANLPWEREKRVQALRDDPAELISLKVFNSSRDGSPLPGQKNTYLESEVKYLTWEATIKNRLAGIEGYNYRLEGQFVDPEGSVAGKSEAGRFVSPNESELSLRGVTLLEGFKERAKGNYQLNVYVGEKKLGTQTIRIEAEPKKVATPPAPPREAVTVAEAPTASTGAPAPVVANPAAELAALEEKKRLIAEAKRQATLEIAREHPLSLIDIKLVNTDKEGNLQAQASNAFELSRFIAWEAKFKNNLQSCALLSSVGRTYRDREDKLSEQWKIRKPGQQLQQISLPHA
jgi:hypothetical protein